jgi:3-methyladenine DNA glycosylase AlkD
MKGKKVSSPTVKTALKSAKPATKMPAGAKWTAAQFVKRMESCRPSTAGGYFKADKKGYDKEDHFMGVGMAQVFGVSREFMAMPTSEIATLLKSPVHEVRVGAVSIMDFQARNKKTPESIKRELFDLYIENHDKINSWGMVDRAAPYVVGGYLFDKPRAVLYKLARSKNIWERRTAIVSTYYFIRQGDVSDTFKIAELLVNDREHFIHTAVGSWIREAGKKDPQRLLDFLDKHAPTMPRTALRYALEHLNKKTREAYMSVK